LLKQKIKKEVKSEFHGIGGPLSVSDQRIHLPLLDEFQNAAEEFGIPKQKILILVTIMDVVIFK
jgi:choline dehydrogenase